MTDQHTRGPWTVLREWDELCVLFNSEKDSGMCRKTYARIKELRAESEVTT